ncbi:MAG: hypothetical protein KUL86_06945 [Castellaniella sp.]|nr:hypothetical protein [Castellaniella sp.]
MKPLMLAVAVLALTVPMLGRADPIPPSHDCRKPYKPISFSSQLDIDLFQDEVERYKRCISDFVDEQNESIQQHRQAAQEAIDEWNQFIKYELN